VAWGGVLVRIPRREIPGSSQESKARSSRGAIEQPLEINRFAPILSSLESPFRSAKIVSTGTNIPSIASSVPPPSLELKHAFRRSVWRDGCEKADVAVIRVPAVAFLEALQTDGVSIFWQMLVLGCRWAHTALPFK